MKTRLAALLALAFVGGSAAAESPPVSVDVTEAVIVSDGVLAVPPASVGAAEAIGVTDAVEVSVGATGFVVGVGRVPSASFVVLGGFVHANVRGVRFSGRSSSIFVRGRCALLAGTQGAFSFGAVAVDGSDAFRLRVWETATGRQLMDTSAGDVTDCATATALESGWIVVH